MTDELEPTLARSVFVKAKRLYPTAFSDGHFTSKASRYINICVNASTRFKQVAVMHRNISIFC
jgi:hypothetical protein